MDYNFDSYDWGSIYSPWIGADVNIWEPLLKDRKIIHIPAKQIIFFQGDKYENAYIILNGRVCHTISSENGQEKQLYIACPGAMIGETSCILSKPHAMTAKTIVATDVCAIPSKELQRLFHDNHLLADLMLQYEARKNQMLILEMASLSFDTAEARIAKMLLYLSETYGIKISKGTKIGIRITCNDLAGIVSTSRVTVNKTLLNFQDQGWLCKDDGRFIITDKDALNNLVENIIEI